MAPNMPQGSSSPATLRSLSRVTPVNPIYNTYNPRNWGPRGHRLDADSINNPEVRESLVRLCDAMAAWLDRKTPRPGPEIATEALKLNSRAVAPIAATALAMIAAEEADPLACIRRALAICPAQSRAIAIRWMRAPGALSLEVQEAIAADGLRDRSRLVREFAVEHVEVLRAPNTMARDMR
jgi:hypothetical protein